LPSTERYIVIGDMVMRLRSVTPLSVNGENRWDMGVPSGLWGARLLRVVSGDGPHAEEAGA